MKIKFLGAARTVTGSCFVVQTATSRFAVDCGMHQGGAMVEKRNLNPLPYLPEDLDFIIVTHAHIDHAGLLPLLVKHGFSGKIYASAPSVALLEIMLADAAHIQEVETFNKNKKRIRKGKEPLLPLYTQEDAQAVLPLLEAVAYNKPFSPAPELSVTLKDAGHILGSAFVTVEDTSGDAPLRIIFSGDIGRSNQFIINDPTVLDNADYLIMESTYGNRQHRNEDKSLEELGEAISCAYEQGGKVLIPAFAVERTQEVIYALYLLSQKGMLPKNIPIFVDSPLAIRATEIFKKHREFLDEETRSIFRSGGDPFSLPHLRYTLSTQDSIAINAIDSPAIIISASGMANAGRIKHHLRHNLWRKSTSLVFVGFQALGTIGRKIIDGAAKVRIFNEDIAVAAKVFTINGFSAHADQRQLLDWLGNFTNTRMQIFLVHGEYTTQEVFQRAIEASLPFRVYIPEYLEEVSLEKRAKGDLSRAKSSAATWQDVAKGVEATLILLQEQQTALSPVQLAKIQKQLAELTKTIKGSEPR